MPTQPTQLTDGKRNHLQSCQLTFHLQGRMNVLCKTIQQEEHYIEGHLQFTPCWTCCAKKTLEPGRSGSQSIIRFQLLLIAVDQ